MYDDKKKKKQVSVTAVMLLKFEAHLNSQLLPLRLLHAAIAVVVVLPVLASRLGITGADAAACASLDATKGCGGLPGRSVAMDAGLLLLYVASTSGIFLGPEVTLFLILHSHSLPPPSSSHPPPLSSRCLSLYPLHSRSPTFSLLTCLLLPPRD